MKQVLADRKNAEVVLQQEKMREQAKVSGKRNEKRIEALREMQEDLRKKFIDANNFITECEAKEKILNDKIAIEEEIEKKLDAEIKDYEERIAKLSDFHENQFKPAIKEMSIYDDVLQEVVDQMDLFESKEDFLDRVEAICNARI